jgi:predicted DNA-binding transcriptional regulator AlpA
MEEVVQKEEVLKKDFVSVEEIAHMLSVPKKTMERIIRIDETFPKPIHLGERIRRWHVEDIKTWLQSKQS